jgi:multicomponent Na+:H+ antiporter subunit G
VTPAEVPATLLIGGGTALFLAGSVGMIRFPDVFCRLHAVTKADNVGLGLIVLGLLVGVGSPSEAAKLVLIWMLALMSSSVACHLVARSALRRGSPQ